MVTKTSGKGGSPWVALGKPTTHTFVSFQRDYILRGPERNMFTEPMPEEQPQGPPSGQTSKPNGQDGGTTPQSKALQLAASLIDTSGTGADATVDELVHIPVDKPNKSQFFRVHPDLHADVNLLRIEGMNGREIYAVVPGMVRTLDNVGLFTLFLGVHRDGSYFLWPISAISTDNWSRSARQIAIAAMNQWCRLVPSRATSTYIKRIAPGCLDVPVWPTGKTFEELLLLAFGDGRIISSPDHPVVKAMWAKD